MKNKIIKNIISILLITFGVFVLFKGENNKLKAYLDEKESLEQFKKVDSELIYAENNDSYINVTGNIIIESNIFDEEINLKIKALKLERKVETYQWNETISKDGEIVYEKVWEDGLLDSTSFIESETHQNPIETVYYSDEKYANVVYLGNYIIDQSILKNIEPNFQIKEFPDDLILKEGFYSKDGYITNSKDLKNPQIGDIKISYYYLYITDATVLGKQVNNGYIIDDGQAFVQVKEGNINLKELKIVELIFDINLWICRIVGIFFCSLGCYIFNKRNNKISLALIYNR